LKNKKRYYAYAFMLFCFFGMTATIFFIVDWKKDINKNIKINQSLKEYISIKEDSKINIDFNELEKINSDTVGYIIVPNTNVNYTVVKAKDNDYYLTHDFNKEYNNSGWIFTDYKNKVDGSDKNLVIYGHETSGGYMFGSLSNLLNEDILKNKENQIISFITKNGLKKYQIFSIYTIKPEKYYITTDFTEEEFTRFKKAIKERSLYKIDASLENKNILTLSTCQNYGVKRLAIHAVEI